MTQYDEGELSYVFVGGFPTDTERHAATRAVYDSLDGGDTALIGFALDDDDDDDDDTDDDKGSALEQYQDVLDPAFRQTDFAPYIEEISQQAQDGNVRAAGYCTGGTLLAAYQSRAHEENKLKPFASVVVLDAPTGIATDHQTVTVPAYQFDDIIGVYDSEFDDQYTIRGIPQIKVEDTDHLWDAVPDRFGDIVRTAAASADMDTASETDDVLSTVTAGHDDLTYVPPEQNQLQWREAARKPPALAGD